MRILNLQTCLYEAISLTLEGDVESAFVAQAQQKCFSIMKYWKSTVWCFAAAVITVHWITSVKWLWSGNRAVYEERPVLLQTCAAVITVSRCGCFLTPSQTDVKATVQAYELPDNKAMHCGGTMRSSLISSYSNTAWMSS